MKKQKPGKRERERLKALREDTAPELSEKRGASSFLKRDRHEDAPISNKKQKSGEWNFEVDYCDHFETPLIAYEHILPFLRIVAANLNKELTELVIFDPYYCQGRTITLLQSLGFVHIINENKDFYASIMNQTVPDYDVLITNPPYSGDHKSRLFDFLGKTQTKPYFCLLPSYIATKSYWRNHISVEKNEPLYILPHIKYEYDHPHGTGHETSPFQSCWFIRLGCDFDKDVNCNDTTLLFSIQEFINRNLATEKRPSSKKRLKQKMKRAEQRSVP